MPTRRSLTTNLFQLKLGPATSLTLVMLALLFGIGWYQASGQFESEFVEPVSKPVEFLRRIGLLPIALIASAVCVPGIIYLVRQSTGNWKGVVLWQTGIAVVFSVVVTSSFCWLTAPAFAQGKLFFLGVLVHMVMVLPVFLATIAVIDLFEFSRIVAERSIVTAKLETQLAHARLDSIAARLQPHFLFNSLQSISTLLYRDPDAADKAIGHLGNLLRRSLKGQDRWLVPLESELDAVLDCVAIYKLRFGERLNFHCETSPQTGQIPVPSFCLQPIVENAITHGLDSGGIRPCEIRVSSQLGEKELRLKVTNSLPTTGNHPAAMGHRMGLQLVRKQLQVHYGNQFELELVQEPEYTAVNLLIPVEGDSIR